MMSYVTQSLELCNDTEEIMAKSELNTSVERLGELYVHAEYLMNDIMADVINQL